MDILAADAGANKVAWHENDGSESFAEHEITTLTNGAHDIQAADVDGDGDLDALAASMNDNTVRVQRQRRFLDACRDETMLPRHASRRDDAFSTRVEERR